MDSKVRDLERSAAGGDLEAQSDLLRSRARSGEITQEQIELLAYVQHPPAWAALGWEFRGHSGNAQESSFARLFTTPGTDLYQVPLALKPWSLGFKRWGREVCLRVGSAACRSRFEGWCKALEHVRDRGGAVVQNALPTWPGVAYTEQHNRDLHSNMQSVVEVALRQAEWCAAAEDTPRRRSDACDGTSGIGNYWASSVLSEDGYVLRPTCVSHFATYARHDKVSWLAGCVANSVRSVLEASVASGIPAFDATGHLTEAAEIVRHAIRDELVAWVCEGRDPVLERLTVQSKGPTEAGPLLRYFPSGDRSPGTEAPSSPELSSPNGEPRAEPPAQE